MHTIRERHSFHEAEVFIVLPNMFDPEMVLGDCMSDSGMVVRLWSP